MSFKLRARFSALNCWGIVARKLSSSAGLLFCAAQSEINFTFIAHADERLVRKCSGVINRALFNTAASQDGRRRSRAVARRLKCRLLPGMFAESSTTTGGVSGLVQLPTYVLLIPRCSTKSGVLCKHEDRHGEPAPGNVPPGPVADLRNARVFPDVLTFSRRGRRSRWRPWRRGERSG